MRWNADNYNQHAGFVSRLGEDLIDLLAPRAGEAILDVGCGDGTLAKKIQETGAQVFGIDSSDDMVQTAAAKGIRAAVMDAQALPFENEFDGVFSNAALHWMKESPPAVVAGVYRALRNGGRFCAEFGAEGNIAAIRAALARVLAAEGLRYEDYDPWYFPPPEEYRALLEQAGFRVLQLQAYERPTPLPTDIIGWLRVFAVPFLAAVPEARHADVLRAVAAEAEGTLKKADGVWYGDYVRCRFLAVKEGC